MRLIEFVGPNESPVFVNPNLVTYIKAIAKGKTVIHFAAGAVGKDINADSVTVVHELKYVADQLSDNS